MRILAALFIASLIPAHFADRPDLNGWAAQLKSQKGNCCSFADAVTVDDPDVDTDGTHYRVRLDGKWIDVPDDALVTVPNRYGSAVVWPIYTWMQDGTRDIQIRCFLPGAGT